jgi:putative ABC transport system substrate-binding protein
MDLRSVVATLAFALSVTAWAPQTFAQTPPEKLQRIGVLVENVPASGWREYPVWKGFFATLVELGHVEGRDFVAEIRSAEGRTERLPAAAAELVAATPDVIVVSVCGASLNAARAATRTIPIVVATCTDDMVAAGVVASLARPGGNVTGQQKLTPELAAKRLELVKEMLPNASRVAVLWNPSYSELTADWQALRGAARALHVTLVPFEARSANDYGPAFAAMTAQRVDAVFMFTDTLGFIHAQALADLAAQHRLPTIYPFRETVLVGGLIAYGPSIPAMFRGAAGYADKILRGARPADLPIGQPTRFDLAVNLKAAKALGITIPQSVLVRATEVIE